MSSKRGAKGKGESPSGTKRLSSKKTKAGSSTPGGVGQIRSYFPSASRKADDSDDAADPDDADFDISMASLSSDDEVVKKASPRPRQSTGTASAKKADASSPGSSAGRGKSKANSSATPRAGGRGKRPPGKSDEPGTAERGAKPTAKAGGASGAKASGKVKKRDADWVPAAGDNTKTVSSPTTTTTTTSRSRPSRAASTKKSRPSAIVDGDTDEEDEEDWDRDSSDGDEDESADESEGSDAMEKGGGARGKRGRRQSATTSGAAKKARSSASATKLKPDTATNGDVGSKKKGKEPGKGKGKGKAAPPKEQKPRGSLVGKGRRLSSISARAGGSEDSDVDAELKSLLSDEPPEDNDKEEDEELGSREVAVNKSDSDEDDDGDDADDDEDDESDYSPELDAPGKASGGVHQSNGFEGKGKKKKASARQASTSSGLSTAKPAKVAGDVEVVLRKLRKLRSGMVEQHRALGAENGEGGGASSMILPSLVDLGLGADVTEVKEMEAVLVMDEIEKIVVDVAESILNGKGFSFRVPTRSSGNQKYVEELDRIVLGDKVSLRHFVSTAMARKTAITTRVIQLVHQVLGKGIHITKRDMFYTDVKLFKDQGESDTVLDDVACMVGCTRSCLNVVASDKGLVVGRVSFLEDGDLIDCTRMGVGGKAIPPYMDKISDIKSDADFILLVEKEAAYMRMAEDRFYQKYPCIVITAKGQPDVATRLFLKRLKRELNIPVMGLVDSDPYGLKILSVYMSGSKNMSYDSASLTTPDIKWLGVRPSDLDRYSIPEQCRLDMTDHDMKTGRELLREEFIKKNPDWYRELELMIQTRKKAEIQSLSAFGFQYLTETYLPQKLQNGDWL